MKTARSPQESCNCPPGGPRRHHTTTTNTTTATTKFPPNLGRTAGHTTHLNPGNLTDLHRQCRAIQPEWLEGIQFGVRRQCTPGFAVLFASLLSHTTPCGVRLGAQYSRPSPDDANVMQTPFVHVDLNPSSLCVNWCCQLQPLRWLRAEMGGQLAPHASSPLAQNQLRIDVLGGASTATLYAWNVQRDEGRMAFAYLQNLTRNLAAGVELCAEWKGDSTPASETALALRYARDRMCVSATASRHAFDVSYWRQLNDSVQLGSSVVFNDRAKAALGSVVYQWQFEDTVVRGMLDSEGSTGFTYTRHIRDLCCNMGISVLFCVPTNKFACGLKFDFEANDKLW